MLAAVVFMVVAGSAQAQNNPGNDFGGGGGFEFGEGGEGGGGGGLNNTVVNSDAGTGGIKGLFAKLTGLINSLIGILISAGLLFFVFHVFQYVTSGADPAKKAEASRYMLYGIVSLLVMVSVWGFVNLLTETTGLEGGNVLPDFK